MTHILKKISVLAIGLIAAAVFSTGTAHAATTNGRIIDDTVFDASGSMSTTDIQNFLNQFPNSCIKNYTDSMPSADPTNAYFNYSGTGTVAQIIRRVSDVYGVNPRVLLTKLEQEENLVTGNQGCAQWRLASAIGFHCFDGANPRTTVFNGTTIQTCVDTDANMGVARQLTKGIWTLKWGKERANGNLNWMVPDDASITYYGPMTQGNRKRCGSCATVYYDGYWSGVYLETGATASLYNYTPYLGQAFGSIWEGWWGAGSTIGVPYQWQYGGQSSSNGSTILATQKATWTVYAKNTGNTTWINSGPNPVRLATSNSRDRNSAFCDSSWISCGRVATLNEATVTPGQIGSFTFTVQAPGAGEYKEYFNLVAEGITWMNDPGLYFGMTVTPPSLTATVTGNTLPSTMTAGATASGTITVRNDGNATWYNTGKFPFNLGTSSPTDRVSQFYTNTWTGQTRLANLNEASVAPGQSGTFSVTLTGAPYNKTYTETYSPVVDGYSWLGLTINQPITVSGGQASPVNTLGLSQSLSAGQSIVSPDGRYRLVMQGDGNLVLYSPYRALWWTRTDGKPANRVVVQSDGNIVLYDAQNRYYWAAMTQGNPNASLVLQDDGNLVLYSASGRPLWSTFTYGKL